MMDLIYSTASLTIIALSSLLNQSTYFTRAWTMQEALFSKRRLMFTDQQAHFMCNRASFAEDIDESADPAGYFVGAEPREFWTQKAESKRSYEKGERRRLGDEDCRQMVANYTQRNMTNEGDSLNAFLGIQNYLVAAWELGEFRYGLPVGDFTQALRWYNDRSVGVPKRRYGFPSWSWTGWAGAVVYDRPLDAMLAGEDDIVGADMTVKLLHGNQESRCISLEGMLVKLKVVTEPFSEAYTSDGQTLLGVLRERNFLHNNTIPSGDYEFLVIERIRTKGFGDTVRQSVDMILLDWQQEIAERRTFVRLSLEKGVDFEVAYPMLRTIQLE